MFLVSWIPSLGRRLVSTQPAVRQLRHHLDPSSLSALCVCLCTLYRYPSGSILAASRGTVCAKGSILLLTICSWYTLLSAVLASSFFRVSWSSCWHCAYPSMPVRALCLNLRISCSVESKALATHSGCPMLVPELEEFVFPLDAYSLHIYCQSSSVCTRSFFDLCMKSGHVVNAEKPLFLYHAILLDSIIPGQYTDWIRALHEPEADVIQKGHVVHSAPITVSKVLRTSSMEFSSPRN